ncbi:MAG: ABC transporter permease [Deltaproteobacteria bacterium]|nr:ABC transporter permease [Deltaproteobacteria bacterium]
MLFWTIVKVALKGLLANKLRTFLAMLGIIIGVGAVISMLALGTGAQKKVMERIASMGTNLLVVRPGQHGLRGRMLDTSQRLKLEDAKVILEQVLNVYQVAPVVGGNSQLKYFNKNAQSNVIGSSITYFPIRNIEIEKGRLFTEVEVERMARVAVIGPTAAKNLFEERSPVDETIKIKGINFSIVGVTKAKGSRGRHDPDDQVIVPYTTAMKQLFGLDYCHEIDIQATDNANLEKVQEATTAILRRRHRLREGMPDDFYIRNQAEIVEAASEMSQTFTILLGSIAGISLLVGGIGIMNIMLVTVTERTREIGVRKAIGAKNRDILLQFLIEAIVLSGLGGIIGVAFGIGAAQMIAKFTQFFPVAKITSILLALSFSATVGVFFGYYPARRAALLDPIKALRYE